MLYIEKMREPAELRLEKRKGLTDYSNLSGQAKVAVQKALLQEQGYLCAYCMKRIDLKRVQIEHYIPQHPEDGDYDPALTIDYHNMLAVCSGGNKSAGTFKNLTCDQHRGNTPLTVDPLDRASIDKIQYKSDGTIFSEDAAIQRDLDITLNLNCTASYLKQNRKAALDQVKKKIQSSYPDHRATKDQLKKMLLHFQEKQDGSYTEFAGVIIWYLKKQISRN